MLPAVLISPTNLISGAGGLAAAIAIGAFLAQAGAVFVASSEESRRRRTAAGGLAGLVVMIGLILYSKSGR